ncbi:hypothetical protein JCM19000A_03500 [Silvimonas sp. JCM 19000]
MLNATSSPALTYTPASLQAEALAYQPPSSKTDTPATSRLPPATPTEQAQADASGGRGSNLQAAIALLNQGSGGWISVKKNPDTTVALTVVSADGEQTGYDAYQRGSVLHTSA